ncbi:MAG: hypothetical protein AAFY72_07915 [Cyanobacteria bacterium J06649_4]
MTPTLLGRWQTRLLLFITVGVLLTVPFSIVLPGPSFQILFWILGWGFVWDILYTFIQKFRWDRDWPAAYQVAAGIWEAFFLLTFIYTFGLFGSAFGNFSISSFIFHYATVWLGIFLASQVLMRLLFPRWRFRGGRLL